MKENKCLYCGCTEFIEGTQSGYASVSPANKIMTFKSQALYLKICLNCGSVVKCYVKNPKVLLTNTNKLN